MEMSTSQIQSVRDACEASGLYDDEEGGLLPEYDFFDETSFALATFGTDGEQRYSRFLVELTKADADLAAALASSVRTNGGMGQIYWVFVGHQMPASS